MRLLGILIIALSTAACRFDPNGLDWDGGAMQIVDAPQMIDGPQSTIDATVHPPIDAPMSVVDARPPMIDAAGTCSSACVLAGGTCSMGQCVIDCRTSGCTTATCPAGMPCLVLCTPSGPAGGGCGSVDCAGATSCTVSCGGGSCQNGVSCGMASSCDVSCSGTSACDDGIVCNSATCVISCVGSNACKSGGPCCMSTDCSTCSHSGGGCCKCGGC
jgi:hypothetical protein